MVSVKETETLDKIKYFVKLYNLDEQYDFLDDISIFFWRCWNWIQWTCLSGLILYRLLARRASRDAPRTKNGCLWTPKFYGEREIIINYFLSVLIYLKRNSFNSHYYYTLDSLINLMVYLAE